MKGGDYRMSRMFPVTASMDSKTLDALDDYARDNRLSRSEAIRRAIGILLRTEAAGAERYIIRADDGSIRIQQPS